MCERLHAGTDVFFAFPHQQLSEWHWADECADFQKWGRGGLGGIMDLLSGIESKLADMGPLGTKRVRKLAISLQFVALPLLLKSGPVATAGESEKGAAGGDSSGWRDRVGDEIEGLKQELRLVLVETERRDLARYARATLAWLAALQACWPAYRALHSAEARALREIGVLARDHGVDADSSSGEKSSEESEEPDDGGEPHYRRHFGTAQTACERIEGLCGVAACGTPLDSAIASSSAAADSSPSSHEGSWAARLPEKEGWEDDVIHQLAILVVSAESAWWFCCGFPQGDIPYDLAGMRSDPGDFVAGAIFAARLLRRTMFNQLALESDVRQLGGLGTSHRSIAPWICGLKLPFELNSMLI